MASTSRPYHVVVWGSTGVVGRLVAEHLTRDYQKQGIKWALAGRNQQKMEEIRQNLASIDPSVKDIPIIRADVTDQASMEALSKKTKVVLATAGPFAKFGTPMVEACVTTGTNYCDITGETNWVRRSIRDFHDKAKQKGVRIVHMAGFDSIPSDLGTWLVTDHIRKQYNKETAKVEMLVTDMKGPLSGGTIVSLFGALLDESGPDKKAAEDPYGLDPPNSRRGKDKGESLKPGHSALHQAWYVPFLMAPVNTRVVRRSNALLDHAYGKKFSYLEAQKVPGRVAAYIGSAVFAVVGVLISVRPLRSFWLKLLPKPGQMPSKESMEKGSWAADLIGVSEGPDAKTVKAVVSSTEGDPGYWSTARLLLESGLCIALQEDELKASGTLQSGVLTPATALGPVLLKRLNAYNKMFSFKITEP